MKIGLILVLLVSLSISASAQALNDTTPVGPKEKSRKYVRLMFENDVLQLRPTNITDHDFTNGVRLDLMGNFWGKLPTRHILLEFPDEPDGRKYDYLYSFSFGQEMYTPDNIKIDTILRNDRPYAGWLYGSWGLVTTDPVGKRKLTSSFGLGVMGPLSRSDSVQSFIHRKLNFPHPAGWGNQIANDIGVSYAVRYETRLTQFHRGFDLIGMMEGHIGTVTNYLGTGLLVRIGQFNDYFQNASGLYDPQLTSRLGAEPKLYDKMNPAKQRKLANSRNSKHPQSYDNQRFQMYVFMRPIIRAVLDNSFLQGGWTSRFGNVHTIPSENIERFYINMEYGGVISFGRTQLTYSQSFRTREFRQGKTQQWGRISLLFGF